MDDIIKMFAELITTYISFFLMVMTMVAVMDRKLIYKKIKVYFKSTDKESKK